MRYKFDFQAKKPGKKKLDAAHQLLALSESTAVKNSFEQKQKNELITIDDADSWLTPSRKQTCSVKSNNSSPLGNSQPNTNQFSILGLGLKILPSQTNKVSTPIDHGMQQDTDNTEANFSDGPGCEKTPQENSNNDTEPIGTREKRSKSSFKMNFNMSEVLPGLYVGNYRDSKDPQQLEKFQITHIIAIHDSPRRLLPNKHYLCVMAADTPDQNLSQYFSICNDFIHAARLRDGNVLIHCLAGMSRSVTVTVAYIMSATNLNWKEALKVVRAGRAVANPNLGFQTQLQEFEMFRLNEERRRLRERFPSRALEQRDRAKCMIALDNYEELLQNKNICEGNCSRGEKCPTGVCNMDPTKGLFRRRPSTSSTRSRLRPQANQSATGSTTAQSCPTSPKHSGGQRRSVGEQQIPEDEEADATTSERATATTSTKRTSQSARGERAPIIHTSDASSTGNGGGGGGSGGRGGGDCGNNGAPLQRSSSTVSGMSIRPRSSPAGLHSYTAGSVPSSVRGSRVDLDQEDQGSAIYLGCSAPRNTSTWSLSSRGSSGGSAPPTPVHTPPVSPRHGIRRTSSQVAKKSR